MSNISWIKKNIIKKMLAALVIVGLLVNMEGVQGIGLLKAQAVNYSGLVLKPGESFDVVASEDSKTQVVFFYYRDQADDTVWSYDGDRVLVSVGETREFSSNASCTAPSMTNVVDWVLVDTRNLESEESYSTAEFPSLIAFSARTQMTVKYDGGSGSATDITENVSSIVASSTEVTVDIELKSADDFDPYNGYEFDYWSDSSGNKYDAGQTVTVDFTTNGQVEFTANWKRYIDINYRPNGGTGSVINKKRYYTSNSDFMETELLGSADFTREGYRLAGWKIIDADAWKLRNYGSSGRDVAGEYALGANCYHGSGADSLTFDAIWERTSVDVSVQYKPNGGTGDAVIQNKTVNVSASNNSAQMSLLDKADFKKTGYTLTGWSDGSKTYSLGANYSFTLADNETSKNLSFDAVWTAKKAGKVEIDVKKPVYVGAKFKYDTDKNSDGDVTLEYKKKGAKDDDYTKKVPTEPGTYTVRATLEETDEYTSAEDTVDFELQYLSAPASPFTYTEVKNSAGTVTDLNVVPASGYSIGVSGKAGDTFGASVLYSAAKKAGGVYLKRDNDDAITEQIQLTEYTVKDTPKVTVTPVSSATGKIYYGTKFTVTATSLSPAEKTITYKKNEAGGTYSAAVPTEPGKYTVRLTAPATDFYAAVDETADFTIDYLEAPSKGASLKGTKGNGGWYTSDVKIEAPTGYLISASPNGPFKESIDWNESITAIYYERESDHARTDAVRVSFDVKIDKDKPTIVFDSSLGITGKEKSVSIYADSLTFTIKDKNLKSVRVGKNTYTVSLGECIVVLTPGLLSETNTLIATDEAGNEYTLDIVLTPAWRQSGDVPMGREVRLLSGEGYKLSARCKLDDKTGDATVYEKNITVFVRTDETYSFVEVQGK